jgi:hypothetical protein
MQIVISVRDQARLLDRAEPTAIEAHAAIWTPAASSTEPRGAEGE